VNRFMRPLLFNKALLIFLLIFLIHMKFMKHPVNNRRKDDAHRHVKERDQDMRRQPSGEN
jgi:hypothetical protein